MAPSKRAQAAPVPGGQQVTAPKKKVGRPSTYSPTLGDAICLELAEGRTVTAVCKRRKLSLAAIWKWRETYPEFAAMYARARVAQAEAMASGAIDLSDDDRRDLVRDAAGNPVLDEEGRPIPNHANVQRSRLRVDTRKWYASKVAPKLFGDRVEVVGAEGGPVQVAALVVDVHAALDAILEKHKRTVEGAAASGSEDSVAGTAGDPAQ